MNGTKRCPKCRERWHWTAFRAVWIRGRFAHLQSWCRACEIGYKRERRLAARRAQRAERKG